MRIIRYLFTILKLSGQITLLTLTVWKYLRPVWPYLRIAYLRRDELRRVMSEVRQLQATLKSR